jgi:hypothetical protein
LCGWQDAVNSTSVKSTAGTFFIKEEPPRSAATRPLADAKFLQDDFGRAKSCERRLDEVRSDKDRKPDPVGMNPVRKGDAGENKRAREDAYGVFEFHGDKISDGSA